MKGLIARTARSACLLGGLIGMVGCAQYRDVVDPCYPERYEAQARKETNQAFAPQVQNGHVLDQTVWDSHFRAGTAELTPGGYERLNYLIQRRPYPDPCVYLQTAQIVPTDGGATTKPIVFDPANPEKMIDARNKLNKERKEAVQKYLVAASNARGLNFNVDLIDVATPGMAAVRMNSMVRLQWLGTPAGVLPIQGQAAPQSAVVGTSTSFP